MKFIKYLILFLLISSSAFASKAEFIFQDWGVFKNNQMDKVVCYILSTPIKTNAKPKERGEAFLMVTAIENDADEVSLSSGVQYKEKSDVEASFGAKKYYLFPYLSRAWANNKNDDIEFIKQLQKNADVVMRSVSKDDKIFHDTYSLIGFNSAYSKMKQICKNN